MANRLLIRPALLRCVLTAVAGVALAFLYSGGPRMAWAAPEQEVTPGATVSAVGYVPAEPRPTLAVSLTLLQENLRRAKLAGQPVPAALAHLGGLNVLHGFTRLPGGELILLGIHDITLPSVNIDDLAVAVKVANRIRMPAANGPREGAGETPGISIDPDPDAEDPWRLQKVRIINLPRSAAMTARFVFLDWELKKVSSGLLRVGDVPSLWALRMRDERLCEGLERDRQLVEIGTRFWFAPRKGRLPRFVMESATQTLLILHPVDAELLSEQQYLDHKGQSLGSAASPPEVTEFTRLITEQLLSTPTMLRYIHLRQDYRVLEIASLMRLAGVPAESLRYLLTDHTLEFVHIPRHVGGIRRAERVEATCDVTVTEREEGNRLLISAMEHRQTREFVSRGGVLAHVPVERSEVAPAPPGHFRTLRAAIQTARPTATAVVWAIPSK